MPFLGQLLAGLLGNFYALVLALVGARYALALSAVVGLATLYVAAVAAFSAFISPLLGSLFSTQYGQFLGLAFPPVAGTVVAGLSGLWLGLMGYRYLHRFVALLVPR